MRYVESRYKLFDREEAYRIYVTDAIRLFGKINVRYYDLFKQGKQMTEEEAQQSAEDIKKRIKTGLNKLGGI